MRTVSCSSSWRTISTRSTTSSWTIIGTKSGSSWNSWEKCLSEMEELEAISRLNIRHNCEEKLVEDRDTILDLTGKIQELQNEVNYMKDSKDIPDAESVRSGLSHVASQPVSFPPHPDPGGCLAVLWECRAAKMGRQAFGTHMENRETSLQIQRRLHKHFIRKSRTHGSLMYQNTHHHMWWVKAKHQFKIRDASQWTNLHDRSQNGPKLVTNDYLVWSLTFIIHVNTNSIVIWETLLNNADWDCFKTPILQGDLEDSKSTSGGTLCVFGSHTFVPISWMCKKQTSVSHSSTESEILSLVAR